MTVIDKNYHTLLEKILQEGYMYDDPNRKGVKRLEIPSYTFRHEFKDGFPAITTKKLNYKSVVTELLWFLRGDTNIKYLVDNGCNIWNKDAYNKYLKLKSFVGGEPMPIEEFISRIKEDKLYMMVRWYKLGDLGPVYGDQWRNSGAVNNILTQDYSSGIDQINNLIKNLKEKPLGTQHIVNSWNVGDLEKMALQPCHYGFQIVVRPLSVEERLNLASKTYDMFDPFDFEMTKKVTHNAINKLYPVSEYGFELHWSQRSVDTFLGLPFNIASYATLTLILEKITGYKALAIQGDLKKVHLYDNSLDAVKEQLSRDVDKYGKCELNICDNWIEMVETHMDLVSLDDLLNDTEPEDFTLDNYESYPFIKCEMLERDE